MKTVTITRLKDELSALLDLVKAGHTIIVLDRATPIAKISRIAVKNNDDAAARLIRLERAGLVRRGSSSKSNRLARKAPPKLPKGVSVLEALLSEREQGR